MKTEQTFENLEEAKNNLLLMQARRLIRNSSKHGVHKAHQLFIQNEYHGTIENRIKKVQYLWEMCLKNQWVVFEKGRLFVTERGRRI